MVPLTHPEDGGSHDSKYGEHQEIDEEDAANGLERREQSCHNSLEGGGKGGEGDGEEERGGEGRGGEGRGGEGRGGEGRGGEGRGGEGRGESLVFTDGDKLEFSLT